MEVVSEGFIFVDSETGLYLELQEYYTDVGNDYIVDFTRSVNDATILDCLPKHIKKLYPELKALPVTVTKNIGE